MFGFCFSIHVEPLTDVTQTKSRVGHAVDGTNFRSDVNANGYIDVVDVSIAKSSVGTGQP